MDNQYQLVLCNIGLYLLSRNLQPVGEILARHVIISYGHIFQMVLTILSGAIVTTSLCLVMMYAMMDDK